MSEYILPIALLYKLNMGFIGRKKIRNAKGAKEAKADPDWYCGPESRTKPGKNFFYQISVKKKRKSKVRKK